MSEWMAIEAIIRQKDKETFAASLANCRMTNHNSGDIPLVMFELCTDIIIEETRQKKLRTDSTEKN